MLTFQNRANKNIEEYKTNLKKYTKERRTEKKKFQTG